eukprot:Protomagalhaensia_sp_Gyna_25__941@NODE_1452_length_1824_cov_3_514286_g1175_i0_p2_GENE_NODE_1452_length_1824_cov_3_514286_g1175_i0NODE_1452_length_1824_cov_3_514286_g1175_i0_p2_ORF_typecomplete_len182_score30_33TPR_1/PF00515_28/8_1e02TPR_1/PF00515_28/0_00018TPR_1/PF00515_28/4_8e08TPR_1/PF00515_28/1_4e03TPR_1/PF00515_28/0_0013TPR_16/PF13432_6/0_00026TPR_16/PF13432_6/2_4e06TPR_16/PF13432_6/0_031TPR_2/PF07719_17/5_7e02TPR_2/PF07719_17/0_027TPR_2/PF07719_17/3_6e08TPR_2/PF07719_17/5_5e02TPR_2/PF07719_
MDEYSKAVKSDPFNSDGWKLRGQCYYKLDDYKSTIKDYNCYLLLRPRDDEVWGTRGYCHYRLKQYTEAIECYTQAINQRHKEVSHWGMRGKSYYEFGNLRLGLKDVDHACWLKPSGYWFHLKGLIHEDLKEYQESQAAYNRALEIEWSTKPSEYKAAAERVAIKLNHERSVLHCSLLEPHV